MQPDVSQMELMPVDKQAVVDALQVLSNDSLQQADVSVNETMLHVKPLLSLSELLQSRNNLGDIWIEHSSEEV